ncbi:uncharacterized protein G2W53_044621 [Senna tora]|uniref:Uncharacterized protein n=1 Tax=Senna tora TaxID=362788 RepID=A0A834VXR2_9FABA|nr:uncharacterized protein G2W53_044621 [Senna tora]
MPHACPLVMQVVPWREALGRGTSVVGNHRRPLRTTAVFRRSLKMPPPIYPVPYQRNVPHVKIDAQNLLENVVTIWVLFTLPPVGAALPSVMSLIILLRGNDDGRSEIDRAMQLRGIERRFGWGAKIYSKILEK